MYDTRSLGAVAAGTDSLVVQLHWVVTAVDAGPGPGVGVMVAVLVHRVVLSIQLGKGVRGVEHDCRALVGPPGHRVGGRRSHRGDHHGGGVVGGVGKGGGGGHHGFQGGGGVGGGGGDRGGIRGGEEGLGRG